MVHHHAGCINPALASSLPRLLHARELARAKTEHGLCCVHLRSPDHATTKQLTKGHLSSDAQPLGCGPSVKEELSTNNGQAESPFLMERPGQEMQEAAQHGSSPDNALWIATSSIQLKKAATHGSSCSTIQDLWAALQWSLPTTREMCHPEADAAVPQTSAR